MLIFANPSKKSRLPGYRDLNPLASTLLQAQEPAKSSNSSFGSPIGSSFRILSHFDFSRLFRKEL